MAPPRAEGPEGGERRRQCAELNKGALADRPARLSFWLECARFAAMSRHVCCGLLDASHSGRRILESCGFPVSGGLDRGGMQHSVTILLEGTEMMDGEV